MLQKKYFPHSENVTIKNNTIRLVMKLLCIHIFSIYYEYEYIVGKDN